MHELDFVREERLQEAWEDIQWNFMEDLERESERRITHFLNKVLRIEANRQLQAKPYERTLERLDYLAGYRMRSVITTTSVRRRPCCRKTPRC